MTFFTNINCQRVCIIGFSILLTACAGGSNSYVSPDAEAAETNMRLGISYMQRGDYEFALEKLEKSLQQDPSLPSAHNTIAILYQRLNETEKAEKHYKEAVARDPDYSEAQNNYGVFLCQKGDFAAAEKRFLLAVENPLYQSAAQAYENAGLCAVQVPNLTKAETYFRQALRINPTLPKSLSAMANVSYEQQNYLQARAYVQRYQQAGQWTAPILLTAIKAENKLGDQNAVSSYALILKARFPDSDELRQVNRGIDNL